MLGLLLLLKLIFCGFAVAVSPRLNLATEGHGWPSSSPRSSSDSVVRLPARPPYHSPLVSIVDVIAALILVTIVAIVSSVVDPRRLVDRLDPFDQGAHPERRHLRPPAFSVLPEGHHLRRYGTRIRTPRPHDVSSGELVTHFVGAKGDRQCHVHPSPLDRCARFAEFVTSICSADVLPADAGLRCRHRSGRNTSSRAESTRRSTLASGRRTSTSVDFPSSRRRHHDRRHATSMSSASRDRLTPGRFPEPQAIPRARPSPPDRPTRSRIRRRSSLTKYRADHQDRPSRLSRIV